MAPFAATGLQLAANLTLPTSVVTETAAFIGTRGSGKTYAAGVLGEEIAHHNQLVVLDPVGVWYGLRMTKDGKDLGVPIAVFGGDHGDVPLAPNAGEMVAAIVAARRINVVLDVSPFTLGEMHRFATEFATHLFQLKKSQRSPLHLILEEAHEFLPQQVGPREAEMVGAFKRIWKIGRNYGIGGTLVSQRPAEMNKGALNLTERMFCGRLKGPQDRKAIEGWAREQEADRSALDQLATLPNGELIHWTDKGVIRVRFREKKTFDASKTPETGDIMPTAMPMLGRGDLDVIRDSMAQFIDQAKANDPRTLRAKVAQLEAELAAVHRGHAKMIAAAPPAAPAKEIIVYRVPDQQPELLADIQRSVEVMEMEVGSLGQNIVACKSGLKSMAVLTERLQAALATASAPQRAEVLSRQPVIMRARHIGQTALRMTEALLSSGEYVESLATGLPKGALAILAVLAGSPVEGMTRRQMATQSGLKVSGGAYAKYLKVLKEGGYLTASGDRLVLTDLGRAHAGEVEIPRGRGALLSHWKQRLPAGAYDVLQLLVDNPAGLTRNECASLVPKPMKASGGGFAKYMGTLVTRGLVTKVPGMAPDPDNPGHPEKRVTLFRPAEMFA